MVLDVEQYDKPTLIMVRLRPICVRVRYEQNLQFTLITSICCVHYGCDGI